MNGYRRARVLMVSLGAVGLIAGSFTLSDRESGRPLGAPEALASGGVTEGEIDKVLRIGLGVVAPNQKVEHLIRVRNTGKEAITPVSVRASCRCVSAIVNHELCQPGGSFDVRVQVQTDSTLRRFLQLVTVSFAESDVPDMRLELLGDVRLGLSSSAHRIDFDNLWALDTQVLTIENFTGGDWDSVSVESDSDWAKVQVVPRRPERNGYSRQVWDCVVTPDPTGLEFGEYSTNLVVKSGGGDYTLEVPCSLLLRPPYAVFPSSWFAIADDLSGSGALHSEIVSLAGGQVDIGSLEVRVTPEIASFLDVELTEDSASPGSVRVVGKLLDAEPASEVRGNVVIGFKGSPRGLAIPVLLIREGVRAR
jgi:hypothetical protein